MVTGSGLVEHALVVEDRHKLLAREWLMLAYHAFCQQAKSVEAALAENTFVDLAPPWA